MAPPTRAIDWHDVHRTIFNIIGLPSFPFQCTQIKAKLGQAWEQGYSLRVLISRKEKHRNYNHTITPTCQLYWILYWSCWVG